MGVLLASAAPWAAAEGGQVVRKGKWECHLSSLFFLLNGGNGCAMGGRHYFAHPPRRRELDLPEQRQQ